MPALVVFFPSWAKAEQLRDRNDFITGLCDAEVMR
jgi:hypothetical protein